MAAAISKLVCVQFISVPLIIWTDDIFSNDV